MAFFQWALLSLRLTEKSQEIVFFWSLSQFLFLNLTATQCIIGVRVPYLFSLLVKKLFLATPPPLFPNKPQYHGFNLLSKSPLGLILVVLSYSVKLILFVPWMISCVVAILLFVVCFYSKKQNMWYRLFSVPSERMIVIVDVISSVICEYLFDFFLFTHQNIIHDFIL